MPGIFINYRTGDEPYGAALLDRELSRRFGTDLVFRAPKSIRPGVDFSTEIPRAVNNADVLLVVIGARWLQPDAAGRRRIDLPGDWVRREISDALNADVPIYPLLFGADRPSEADLPEDIAAVARLQDIRIHHRSLRYDLRRLVDALLDIPALATIAEAARNSWPSPPAGAPAVRGELETYLSSLLPAAQQRFGNRRNIVAAILHVVDPDELVVFVAPCRFTGRAYGSALAIATNRCLRVVDLSRPDQPRQVIRLQYHRIRRVVMHQPVISLLPGSSVEVIGLQENMTLGSLLKSQAVMLADILQMAASAAEPSAQD